MEPVTIGAKEIYDSVKDLQGQLNAFALSQSVELAEVKKDVAALQAKDEKRWKLNLALVSAVVSPVVAVTLPFIVR